MQYTQVSMNALLYLSVFIVAAFADYANEQDYNDTINNTLAIINETTNKITDDMEIDDFLRFMGFLALHG